MFIYLYCQSMSFFSAKYCTKSEQTDPGFSVHLNFYSTFVLRAHNSLGVKVLLKLLLYFCLSICTDFVAEDKVGNKTQRDKEDPQHYKIQIQLSILNI